MADPVKRYALDAPSLIEDIRFGYGPKAGTVPAPGGLEPDRLLAQLTATDPAAAVFDRPPLADRLALIAQSKVGNPNITPDSSIGRQ